MAAATKKRPAKAVEKPVDEMEMREWMNRVEKLLAQLTDAIIEPASPALAKKGLRAKAKTDEARRLLGRISRQAKRFGMTPQQWIRRYGDVDHWSKSEKTTDPPKNKPTKIVYRKRAPKDAAS